MKIRLILPKATSREGTLSDFSFMLKLLTPKTSAGSRSTMAFMPLALPTLAALTPGDVEIRIEDENLGPITFDEPVDVVGITFVSFMAPRAYQIADAFRERGVHVALGGVHATLMPEEAAIHADSVFIGEAEETWPQFIEDFRSGRPQPVYRCTIRTDLQRLVLPRWDLVANRYYLTQLVQTTRGCSNACDFCMIRSLFGPPRTKPVQNVIAEILQITKLKRVPGPLKLMFADDNIVADGSYARQLFEALIPLRLRWSSQASLSLAEDEELLDLAVRSGCDTLLLGFESIAQQNLDAINKGRVNRVDRFREAIARIHARGINVYAYFIFGFEQDTPEIFQRTLDFVRETAIEFPLYNILTPAPGTRLWDHMQADGRLLPFRLEEMNGYCVSYKPARMTAQELLDGFRWSIAQSYSAEAIFERLEKAYACGAAKTRDQGTLTRAAVGLILLNALLRQPKPMRACMRRALKALWIWPDLKVNALLMFLDRFEFAQNLLRAHPEIAHYQGGSNRAQARTP